MNRLLFAVVVSMGMTALAARPAARGHAAPGGFDGQSEGERFLATLSPATREALKKDGQAVLDQQSKGTGDGLVRAVIRFERPRDEVFALITQPSQQVKYLPHVTQSKTVGRSDEGEATDMVVAFFFTFRYRTQHWFYPEEHRMEWNLDPSGDDGLVEQLGFFQLYELDEKTTIAEYGTRVVANGGFINFLRGLGERGGVAEALTSIRRHMN